MYIFACKRKAITAPSCSVSPSSWIRRLWIYTYIFMHRMSMMFLHGCCWCNTYPSYSVPLSSWVKRLWIYTYIFMQPATEYPSWPSTGSRTFCGGGNGIQLLLLALCGGDGRFSCWNSGGGGWNSGGGGCTPMDCLEHWPLLAHAHGLFRTLAMYLAVLVTISCMLIVRRMLQ